MMQNLGAEIEVLVDELGLEKVVRERFAGKLGVLPNGRSHVLVCSNQCSGYPGVVVFVDVGMASHPSVKWMTTNFVVEYREVSSRDELKSLLLSRLEESLGHLREQGLFEPDVIQGAVK